MAISLLWRRAVARPLRIHAPGVASHIYSRGNNKGLMFRDSVDFERYLTLLDRSVRRFGATCHWFCLMDTHFHLVLTTWTHSVARVMHHVNASYCAWFNKRHRRVGHVVQGRYHCTLIDEGTYFLNVIRYIALNPVVAGCATRPEDWPWSSYGALMGKFPVPRVLDFSEIFWRFDADTADELRVRLKTFVEAGDAGEGWHSLVYGSEAFKRRMAAAIEPQRGHREYRYADRYATRPPLASLLKGLEGAALAEAVVAAFRSHAYTLREIGDAVGGRHPSTIWRWIDRTVRQ